MASARRQLDIVAGGSDDYSSALVDVLRDNYGVVYVQVKVARASSVNLGIITPAWTLMYAKRGTMGVCTRRTPIYPGLYFHSWILLQIDFGGRSAKTISGTFLHRGVLVDFRVPVTWLLLG